MHMRLLLTILLATALVSCAPAAPSPQPTAKPTEAATKPAQPAPKSAEAKAAPAASKKPSTLAELASYRGADREQLLLEGAQKEGVLVWYTSLAGGVVQDLAKAFEAKYPGIDVQEFRANTEDVIARVQEEHRAKNYKVDVMETNQDGSAVFLEEGMLVPYWSPHLAKYPDSAQEKASGDQVYWTVARQSFIGFGYNTNLFSKEAVPKSWTDLANPALKGKMAMSGSGNTGARAFAGLMKATSVDWVKQNLWPQNYRIQEVSGAALRDLIVNGEVVASPTIFRNHVLDSKAKGAPIDWAPMEPVPTNGGATSIPVQAPHPHAALLWADFILGPDGQKVLENRQYGSPAKSYGFEVFYPESGLPVEQYDKKIREWSDLMRQGAGRGG